MAGGQTEGREIEVDPHFFEITLPYLPTPIREAFLLGQSHFSEIDYITRRG